ncbi:hypothetical protein M747DRAFT_247951 [Aspergillus niger ATCC 13496]|uniref:Contig An07c0010, genomic contig n=3 Tax=Aspergillus niger TaxID=5061 RepID=A2QM41_ASPNC|nr:uncharacterized protein An07g00720 [Aspergillus niger]RDH15099.1 hypothetical protein M747DRAFT_247951 [Aspergillus niger ATCC 13496]CAK39295.1 unnamed protein product [Aspergillus niger]
MVFGSPGEAYTHLSSEGGNILLKRTAVSPDGVAGQDEDLEHPQSTFRIQTRRVVSIVPSIAKRPFEMASIFEDNWHRGQRGPGHGPGTAIVSSASVSNDPLPEISLIRQVKPAPSAACIQLMSTGNLGRHAGGNPPDEDSSILIQPNWECPLHQHFDFRAVSEPHRGMMLWPDHDELRVTIRWDNVFKQWGLVDPFSRIHEARSAAIVDYAVPGKSSAPPQTINEEVIPFVFDGASQGLSFSSLIGTVRQAGHIDWPTSFRDARTVQCVQETERGGRLLGHGGPEEGPVGSMCIAIMHDTIVSGFRTELGKMGILCVMSERHARLITRTRQGDSGHDEMIWVIYLIAETDYSRRSRSLKLWPLDFVLL